MRPTLNRWRCGVDGAPVALRVGGVPRCDDPALALTMALEGPGIVRARAGSAAPHVAAGRVVPLPERFLDSPPAPIHAVMLPDRPRLPKVRAGVDHLAAFFAAQGR